METNWNQRCKGGGRESGLYGLQRQMSPSKPLIPPNSRYNSSFREIADETLRYMSAIFEDTMDPSITENVIGTTADPQLEKVTNEDEVILGSKSQTKTNFNSWLCIPEEKSQEEDFSISFIPPQNDNEELESGICNKKSNFRMESNSTFDIANGSKEGSFGPDSTQAVNCVKANITFEKSTEHKEMNSSAPNSAVSTNNGRLQGECETHLSSTIDMYSHSSHLNVTTGQPNEKPVSTVDITCSDVSKQEQANEALTTGEDCEKNSNFTKASKEIGVSIGSTGAVEQNGSSCLHTPAELCEQCSVNDQAPDGTFDKPNTMADVSHTTHPSLTISSISNTEDALKTCDIELIPQSSTDVHLSGPSDPVSTVAVPVVNIEEPVCSKRILDLPEVENNGEHQRGHFPRINGVSDGECHFNLNVSHSSVFSLDDTLDMKSRALVTSTPIVLSRGFDRLGSAKLTNTQRRPSVINSIDTQSTDDLGDIGEHDGFDASETSPSSTKSDSQKVSTTCSLVSKPAAVNKPPSKLAVRRKIPQLAFKSSIPKSQIPQKPPTRQETAVLVNSKGVPTKRPLNQSETSASSQPTLRRTVELYKRKNIGPAKITMTTATAGISAMNSGGCNLTADSKPSNITKPKASSLLAPGQKRLCIKPPGSAAFSMETGHSQPSSKQTGLTGVRTRSSLLPSFAQKHVSNDVLPLAKRKKTGMQDPPICAEPPSGSNPGDRAQNIITASKDNRIKGPSTGCENCMLIQEKICTFHQELGEFLQELKRIPTDCEKWLPFQQKFELCLEEFSRLQAAHQ